MKLGLIGLDTSHCVAFCNLLNDETNKHHVAGGKIVAAFPGGSPDFELSRSRVEGFTEELRSKFQVQILETPEEVARCVDALLITSADGRVHPELFSRIREFGKPTFIDKPFAVSSAAAREISALSESSGAPVMSCSSLRFADPLVEAIRDASLGPISGSDCSGPMNLEPTQPGYFWYGIHAVEMMYSLMGEGCESVTAVRAPDHEFAVGRWMDGRIGTVRGKRKTNSNFTATIQREKGAQFVDAYNHPRPPYAGMLEQMLQFFRSGHSPIALSETLELVRFMEAANESRDSGQTVLL